MGHLTREQWSNLWEDPVITTFGDAFKNNYDGSIREFWETQVQTDYEQILDVACGNGALTWIINDILNQKNATTKITGTDIADIKPFQILSRDPEKFPRINFVGNTPAERLPFEDSSVDLLVSQYGIEYSDLKKAVPEAGRILKSTSKICLIVHDRNSDVIVQSSMNLAPYRQVLNDIKLHDLCLDLDKMMRSKGTRAGFNRNKEIKKKKQRIQETLPILAALKQQCTSTELLDNYVTILLNVFSAEAKRKKVNRRKEILQITNTLSDYIDRVDDMYTTALDDLRRAELVAHIESEGFEIVENRKLEYMELKNMGTILVAKRS